MATKGLPRWMTDNTFKMTTDKTQVTPPTAPNPWQNVMGVYGQANQQAGSQAASADRMNNALILQQQQQAGKGIASALDPAAKLRVLNVIAAQRPAAATPTAVTQTAWPDAATTATTVTPNPPPTATGYKETSVTQDDKPEKPAPTGYEETTVTNNGAGTLPPYTGGMGNTWGDYASFLRWSGQGRLPTDFTPAEQQRFMAYMQHYYPNTTIGRAYSFYNPDTFGDEGDMFTAFVDAVDAAYAYAMGMSNWKPPNTGGGGGGGGAAEAAAKLEQQLTNLLNSWQNQTKVTSGWAWGGAAPNSMWY